MGQATLGCVGVDDALLDLVQHLDSFLHILGVPHRNGTGVMDHQHSNRAHLDGISGHGNNGRRRCSNRIDLDRDAALVVLEHGIDLGSSKHIAARAVDPDGHITLTGIQLIPEHLRCNFITPERFLVDGAFQPKGSGLVTVLDPVPELFHIALLSFCRFGVLSLCRFSLSGVSSSGCVC